MKVVYHFGTEINAQTVVKKGLLQVESIPFRLICDGKTYVFDQVRSTCITKECGGTMVRVENGKDSVFLTVHPFGNRLTDRKLFCHKKVKKEIQRSENQRIYIKQNADGELREAMYLRS